MSSLKTAAKKLQDKSRSIPVTQHWPVPEMATSSFYNRMKKTVLSDYLVFARRIAEHGGNIDRALSFFYPEWKARDGRFIPRLQRFADGRSAKELHELLWGVWGDEDNEYDDEITVDRAVSVASVANASGYSFDVAMSHILGYASHGFVERVPPFANQSGVPVYHFKFTTSLNRILAAFSPPKEKVVSVADLGVKEAKEFFRGVENDSTTPDKLVSLAAIEPILKKIVADAMREALVHPAVQQLDAVLTVLREKKLDTKDPAATIRAKLNKKRAPR